MATTVYSGTAVLSTVTFKAPTGTITDPTTVTVRYGVSGSWTTHTYTTGTEITKVSTGVYQVTIPTTEGANPWQVIWTGTGACAAVGVASFTVSAVPA